MVKKEKKKIPVKFTFKPTDKKVLESDLLKVKCNYCAKIWDVKDLTNPQEGLAMITHVAKEHPIQYAQANERMMRELFTWDSGKRVAG